MRRSIVPTSQAVLTVLALAQLASGAGVTDGMTTNQAARQLRVEFPGVVTHERGHRTTRVFGTPFAFGTTPDQTADEIRLNYAAVFGVSADDLEPAGVLRDGVFMQPVVYDPETDAYTFTLVTYTQHKDGIPVYNADLRILVRNEPDFPAALIASSTRNLDGYAAPAAPGRLDVDRAVQAGLAIDPELSPLGHAESVIWAGVDDQTVQPRLAVTFEADNGRLRSTDYQKWRIVVDAVTGTILHRENLVHDIDVGGTVEAYVSPYHRARECGDPVLTPLPHARVSLGSDVVYTEEDGSFVLPHDGVSPVTVVSRLRGRWFDVNNMAGSDAVLIETVSPPGPVHFVHNNSWSELTSAEVNCYLEAHIVRDFALAANPSYPIIGTQSAWPINVNLDDNCNAFYNGSSINFFTSGGGCNNTGFGDVVHHEYGHHLVNVGGSGQGQYGEGMGDVMAMLITGRPEMGTGFRTCDSGIRDADNRLQYPCASEIHYCGQLLSGCVWDTREALMVTEPERYEEILRALAVNSILLHSGSYITPQVTIDFLVLDDDDADLSNGTPHREEICSGFGAHNMDCPEFSPIAFEFPDGRPPFARAEMPTTFRVNVIPLEATPMAGTGELTYSLNGGSETTVAMVQTAPNQYEATLPAATCGGEFTYYVSAEATDGRRVNNPVDAPAETHAAVVATHTITALDDDFETDQEWEPRQNPTLTDGAWQRGVPAGSGGQGDPITDYDGSGQCYVTGLARGSDVDDGYAWLLSPTLDLSGGDADVEFALWYTNYAGSSPQNDLLKIYVSNNDGVAWTVVDVLGPETTYGWRAVRFRVGHHVTPTDQVRVRIEASDLEGASTVEAAVDAFRVTVFDCEPDGTCDDGARNQFEERIDCGGPCPPCECTSDDACDNGIFCDGAETCDDFGVCRPATGRDCDDGLACTSDHCDESLGTCVHEPNDSACDNGLFCDGVERCDVHDGCLPGDPVTCNDLISCTADACDEASDSCSYVPDDAFCDDQIFCNGVEACDAEVGCVAGEPVECDDDVACTVDLCFESAGECLFIPSDDLCDDGLFCNGAETCDGQGGCVSGGDPCLGLEATWCNEIADACQPLSDADFNGDGAVNLADYAILQQCFGRAATGPCSAADLTGDGAIGADDLAALIIALEQIGPA